MSIMYRRCKTTVATSATFWIISVFIATNAAGEIIFRVDPLALLSATLRTYQRAGCDTDHIALACPRGTSISIELAQYGKADGNDGITIEELCSSGYSSSGEIVLNTNSNNSSSSQGSSSTNSNNSITNTNVSTVGIGSNGTSQSGSNGTSSRNGSETNSPENCLWPNALQYSLLQTVVEACQKKKHCKFNATPGAYAGGGSSGVSDGSGSTSIYSVSSSLDPCPKVRKFVEIAYKCRPYEFRSKVACENDVIQLECNPYSRIAVYSASFGRTEYESIQCPQPQGVKEETCLASYATETVMQICHGRRRCNLSADSTTFGSPCRPNSRMYLKVVYTCVPKQVLKDRYETTPEPDEPEHFEGDTNDLYDEDQFYKESEAIPKLQSNLTQRNVVNVTATTTEESITSPNPIMTQSKGANLEDDQERLYFYLLIAGSAGVLVCILIVIARVIFHKRRERNENQSSSPKGETTLPNGFNDSISEIDADIDLTTTVPVPSVSKNENYITYGPSASLYGSLGPSNVSHTSTTMLLPTNSLLCARQSPDIIGVSNTFIGQPHVSSAIGTIVPISSLAQYTTAPTFHPGYIMDHEGVLRRPLSAQQQQQQQQALLSHQSPQQGQQPPPQSDTFHYDGTAPRTLSTGVPHTSQFYYG